VRDAILIAALVVLLLAIGWLVVALWSARRAVQSYAASKATAVAQKKAVEVMHAPDADIAARVEQLRARGRAGK
jgi:cell division protein FtsB